jgi:hypothetical protein
MIVPPLPTAQAVLPSTAATDRRSVELALGSFHCSWHHGLVAVHGRTVSGNEPDALLTVAVTTTSPAVTACSMPVVEIVAMLVSEVSHDAAASGTTSPNWSRVTASSCTLSPSVGVNVGLVTVTDDATRTGPLPPPPHPTLKSTATATLKKAFVERISLVLL